MTTYYLLKRTHPKPGYVAPTGCSSSYVLSPLMARRFSTVESAERNRCVENEVIVEYTPSTMKEVKYAT